MQITSVLAGHWLSANGLAETRLEDTSLLPCTYRLLA